MVSEKQSGVGWGYIDSDGQVRIPPQFELADFFRNGLAIAEVGGLSGYIEPTGRWVLPPIFEGLTRFENGFARAIRDSKWGRIDRTGQFVSPPQYDYWGSYCDGLARVEVDGRDGYIDISERMVIPPQFEYAHDFRNGFALVSDPDDSLVKWFIDPAGRKAFGPYRAAEEFSEGWAMVWDGMRTRFIDNLGQIALELPHRITSHRFREGVAAAEDQSAPSSDNWRRGYVDRQGHWVIPPQYDFAGQFEEGYAVVELGNKKGLIDKQGGYVIPLAEFSNLDNPYENRIAFSRDSHSGVTALPLHR